MEPRRRPLQRHAICCYLDGVNYRDLQAALDGSGAAIGAAEAHGWLCGALCARPGYSPADWLRELAQTAATGATAERSAETLCALHEETLEALRSPEFGFAPILPADEAGLDERVAALAAWCSGFLYGFGSGGAGTETGDVGEFLVDLAEIARARVEPGPGGEDGESDYAELAEFVRAGAQLAFDELAAGREGSAPAGAAIH